MFLIRSVLFLLYFSIPFTAGAAVTSGDLPDGTLWYLHADLEQMRSAEPGQNLYAWLDDEMFMEIEDEIGIDLGKEVNSVIAYSSSSSGTVILIEGPLRKETQERLIAAARIEGSVTDSAHKGKDYFLITDDDDSHDYGDGDRRQRDRKRHRSGEPLQDLEDGAYFSFALKNKLLVTGSEEQMKELLDSGGKLAGGSSHDGALFVLTADRAFVQAGLNTDEIDHDDDDDWNSTILRNTEQVALTVAGVDDMISVEAQLVSTDPAMAQSLGGIANGLLSLQAFNSELDPEIKSLILNTKIDVNDNVLSISTVITPEVIIRTLDH